MVVHMKIIANIFLFTLFTFLLFVQTACGIEFAQVKDQKIIIDNKEFQFSGANQYYFFYKPQAMVDEVFEDAKSLNMNVIRTWAFCDGGMHDGFCFQPEARKYDEPTFKKLDYVIYKAKKENIKLVLALANNWGDFGGINQYLSWTKKYNHDDFFRDEDMKSIYRDYVKYVLNRVNTYTGVAYKDEPTILMWELMNEPRCGDKYALYNWIDEMSGYIKTIDTNHLVTTGSEGAIDSDPFEAHKSKNIDVVSFHLYPDWWGFNEQQANEYIVKHAQVAKSLNKPVFLGEYGLKDRLKRNEIFTNWYSLANQNNVSGMLLWILSGKQMDGSLYPDYDGFTVWCPEFTTMCDNLKKLSIEKIGAQLSYP
jgi:mannan endo-1,4-beta-mannosidase